MPVRHDAERATLDYDVPRPSPPSPSLSTAGAAETTEVGVVRAREGLTSDVGINERSGQLFTQRDRDDVTMTSDELHALLTE